jgi:hypothetical protein
MPDTSALPRTPKTPAPAPSGGGSFLNQKIAGVPLWIVFAVAGVAIFVYLQKKKSTTTTGKTATATGTQAGYGEAGQGAAGGVGPAGISGPVNYLEQALNANAQAATTNPQWEANAEAVLNGYGYPFVQVQAALNQYLAGGVLSSVQQEIVNAAIEAVGAPPSAPTQAPVGTATPVTTGTQDTGAEGLQGSGFGYLGGTHTTSTVDIGGVTYEPISTAPQLAAAQANKLQLSYQPVEGEMITGPAPGEYPTGLAPNTPLFTQVPAPATV